MRKLLKLNLGRAVQRLFSTFPGSWPGLGLLLIRLGLGIILVSYGSSALSANGSKSISFTQTLIAAALGILVVAGLWTPVVGIGVALDEVWIAMSLRSGHLEHADVHLFRAVVAISMAMLGPGAWSIDARLFGRKRFDLDRGDTRRSRYQKN